MPSYAGRGVHRQTVELIGGRILSGAIAEGSTISIDGLQAELGVSLTAVREALKVLAAKGLVGARQKRGTFVRPRADWNLLDGDVIRWQFSGRDDPRFLEDLDEVRAVVEPAGARFAAQRRTAEDLEQLDGALTAMGTAADAAAAVSADLTFHRTLLAASHNELMERMEVVIEAGLAARDRLVHGIDYGDEPRDDPVPSHQAVLDAVRAGDPDGAERAMRDLLAKATRDHVKLSPMDGPSVR